MMWKKRLISIVFVVMAIGMTMDAMLYNDDPGSYMVKVQSIGNPQTLTAVENTQPHSTYCTSGQETRAITFNTTEKEFLGNGQYGYVMAVGDFDDDGSIDLAIGAPDADSPNGTIVGCGAVYIFLNSSYDRDLSVEYANLTLYGIHSNDRFGSALDVGDVNGDNIDDLLIGAPGLYNNSGGVYVLYGGTHIKTHLLGDSLVNGITTGWPLSSGSVWRAVRFRADYTHLTAVELKLYTTTEITANITIEIRENVNYTASSRPENGIGRFVLNYTTKLSISGMGWHRIDIPDVRLRYDALYWLCVNSDTNGIDWVVSSGVSGHRATSTDDGATWTGISSSNIYNFRTYGINISSSYHTSMPGGEFGASVLVAGDIDASGLCDLVVGAPEYNESRGRIDFIFDSQGNEFIEDFDGNNTPYYPPNGWTLYALDTGTSLGVENRSIGDRWVKMADNSVSGRVSIKRNFTPIHGNFTFSLDIYATSLGVFNIWLRSDIEMRTSVDLFYQSNGTVCYYMNGAAFGLPNDAFIPIGTYNTTYPDHYFIYVDLYNDKYDVYQNGVPLAIDLPFGYNEDASMVDQIILQTNLPGTGTFYVDNITIIGERHYLIGEDRGDKYGYALEALGDVNDDGIDDIAVSAPYHGTGGKGRVYILFGNGSGAIGYRDISVGSYEFRDPYNKGPALGYDIYYSSLGLKLTHRFSDYDFEGLNYGRQPLWWAGVPSPPVVVPIHYGPGTASLRFQDTSSTSTSWAATDFWTSSPLSFVFECDVLTSGDGLVLSFRDPANSTFGPKIIFNNSRIRYINSTGEYDLDPPFTYAPGTWYHIKIISRENHTYALYINNTTQAQAYYLDYYNSTINRIMYFWMDSSGGDIANPKDAITLTAYIDNIRIYNYEDDFDRYADDNVWDNDLNGEWTVVTPTGTNITLTSTTANSGENSIMFNDTTNTDSSFMYRVIGNLSHGIISVALYMEHQDSGFAIYLRDEYLRIGPFVHLYQGYIYYENGTSPPPIGTYNFNEWFLLTIAFNSDTHTYDIYIDDYPIAQSLDYWESMNGTYYVIIQSGYYIDCVGNTYIDDITIGTYLSDYPYKAGFYFTPYIEIPSAITQARCSGIGIIEPQTVGIMSASRDYVVYYPDQMLGKRMTFYDNPTFRNRFSVSVALYSFSGERTPTALSIFGRAYYVGDMVIDGANFGGQYGSTIANLGDVNGDGYKEIAVTSPSTSIGGSVYVYTLGGPRAVRINEFLPNPDLFVDHDHDNITGDSDEEYIELFNSGTYPVDLSNWKINDSAGTTATIPVGVTIPAGGYLVLYADDTGHIYDRFGMLIGTFTVTGSVPGLNNNGDSIKLYTDTNELIDFVSYGSAASDVSYGRLTDGDNNIGILNELTPGVSNDGFGGSYMSENAAAVIINSTKGGNLGTAIYITGNTLTITAPGASAGGNAYIVNDISQHLGAIWSPLSYNIEDIVNNTYTPSKAVGMGAAVNIIPGTHSSVIVSAPNYANGTVYMFIQNLAPSIPVLIEPANGTVISNTTGLIWFNATQSSDAEGDTIYYVLYIDDAADATPMVLDEPYAYSAYSALPMFQVQSTVFTSGRTYIWGIVAIDPYEPSGYYINNLTIAYPIPFNENFEPTIGDGWTFIQTGLSKWNVTGTVSNSPPNSLYCGDVSTYIYPPGINISVYTPWLDLDNIDTFSIKYYENMSISNGDTCRIFIEDLSGQKVEIYNITGPNNTQTTWRKVNLTINNTFNDFVRFEFNFVSDSNHTTVDFGWAIDDIMVLKVSVPVLSMSPEPLFSGGFSPQYGNQSTNFTFKIVYYEETNRTPAYINLIIDGMAYTMLPDTNASLGYLKDGNLTNGEQYFISLNGSIIGPGVHEIAFEASNGYYIGRYPSMGTLSGPTVYIQYNFTINVGIYNQYALDLNSHPINVHYHNLGMPMVYAITTTGKHTIVFDSATEVNISAVPYNDSWHRIVIANLSDVMPESNISLRPTSDTAIDVFYYEQHYVTIELINTTATECVWVNRTLFGNSINDTGVYGTWAGWCDAMSNLTISPKTLGPSELNATTITSYIIDTSRNITIEYMPSMPTGDSIKPQIFGLEYPSDAGTGTVIYINATVTDNTGIGIVLLLYRFEGETSYQSVEMSLLFQDTYTVAMEVSMYDSRDIYFYIQATDVYSNINSTGEYRINIYDSIAPEISDLVAPTNAGTGETITIEANIKDNIGLKDVTLYYRYGDTGQYSTIYMTGPGGNGTYSVQITVRDDFVGKLYIYIEATDSSEMANIVRYPTMNDYSIEITDTIPPNVDEVTGSITVDYGTEVTIVLKAYDNIGIVNVSIHIGTEEYEMTSLNNGTYVYIIYTIDYATAEGGGSIGYYITVSDGVSSVRVPADKQYTITIMPAEIVHDAPNIEIYTPVAGAVYSGEITIAWSLTDNDTVLSEISVDIYYSQDNGTTYMLLAKGIKGDSIYVWDTTTVGDGDQYVLKITATDNTNLSTTVYVGPFTINNPDDPVIVLSGHSAVEPGGSGTVSINYGDYVVIDASGSYDPDGTQVYITWYLNGTEYHTGTNLNLSTISPGIYKVRVVVRDENNGQSQMEFNLTIKRISLASVEQILIRPENPAVGQQVSVNISLVLAVDYTGILRIVLVDSEGKESLVYNRDIDGKKDSRIDLVAEFTAPDKGEYTMKIVLGDEEVYSLPFTVIEETPSEKKEYEREATDAYMWIILIVVIIAAVIVTIVIALRRKKTAEKAVEAMKVELPQPQPQPPPQPQPKPQPQSQIQQPQQEREMVMEQPPTIGLEEEQQPQQPTVEESVGEGKETAEMGREMGIREEEGEEEFEDWTDIVVVQERVGEGKEEEKSDIDALEIEPTENIRKDILEDEDVKKELDIIFKFDKEKGDKS